MIDCFGSREIRTPETTEGAPEYGSLRMIQEDTEPKIERKPASQMSVINQYIKLLREVLADEEKWYLEEKMPSLHCYGYTLTQSLGNIHRMQEKCNGIQRELIEYESNLKEAENK